MKQVIIAMGSKTDLPVMQKAADALSTFDIPSSLRVLSAHRTPNEVANFAKSARSLGVRVIIAGAGGAAHLPGMLAAFTELPVIGVPVPLSPLQGNDALLSIVQMPQGIPVATVAIGNAWNAGVLAAQILSLHDEKIAARIVEYRHRLREHVMAEDAEVALTT
jgi:phosphoribosylaminoimidazole carboxylase PurE protein